MSQRLPRLRQKLVEEGLDAMLISQPDNRRYLSGFVGTAGFLLISHSSAIVATDFRYVEQAGRQAPEFEIFQAKKDLPDWLPSLLQTTLFNKLGFEAADLTFAAYTVLNDAVTQLGHPGSLVATHSLVEKLRAVKEPDEIYGITAAARMADAAIEHARNILKRGMTEQELAWEIERFMRENGSGPLAFSPIVGGGTNGAMPHHRPTNRALGLGEPIVIDIGANADGYLSDITRTLCLERRDDQYDKLYHIVLEAQLAAMERVEPGIPATEVDRTARDYITAAGYGDAFGHGLGHGIGLAEHEDPRISPTSEAILEENMVFTIEPGIYLEDWGGIRIEDMVVIENGRARVLTQAPK